MDIGAFETPESLSEAIKILRRERQRVRLTGVMFYDGHGSFRGEREFRQIVADDAQRRYAAWMGQLESIDYFDSLIAVRDGTVKRVWRTTSRPGRI